MQRLHYMKIILQRVKGSSVTVENTVIGAIEQGLMLLIGFGKEDEMDALVSIDKKIDKSIEKILHLRIFPNSIGKLDYSILDVGGGILAVPQFTLYGQAQKGRRPDFGAAMAPDAASCCFDLFVSKLRLSSITQVETGKFGADMQVTLLNDGPFTLALDY